MNNKPVEQSSTKDLFTFGYFIYERSGPAKCGDTSPQPGLFRGTKE